MTWWADANARAAGLTGHLLDAEAWRRVRMCADVPALCRELQRLGYAVSPGDEPRTVEQAIDRMRRRREAVLRHWLGERVRYLRLHLEVDDFHALRALLRRAVDDDSAAPAKAPLDALRDLADREEPLAMRAVEEHRAFVERWPDLPSLFALEQALLRAFAARALEGARRARRGVPDRVRRAIDLTNARAILALGTDRDVPAEAVFLAGGEALPFETFREAFVAPDERAARALLGAPLPGAFGAALADPQVSSQRLDRALLLAELDAERRAARQDPLGPAPVFLLLARQQLEARDLRGLLWARALGAPPDPERWT